MKYIDLNSWNRREHYDFFKSFDYPQFNICGNLDITKFNNYIRNNKLPFFISILYATSKAANSIEELKLRIRDEKVVLHDTVSPSFTVMAENEVFSFCTVDFFDSFKEFKAAALDAIDHRKSNGTVENEDRDDLLYMTSIPWFTFTSVTHPIHMNPVDSFPRISWGKYFENNEKLMLPISVQAHHGLVDGIHVGKYFNLLQEILNTPENHLK